MSSAAKPTPAINSSMPENALDFSESIAFSDNPYPLADIFVFYKNFTPPVGSEYIAAEFILEWCVQEFDTAVVNGAALTTRSGSTNKFEGGDGVIEGPYFNSTTVFDQGPAASVYDVVRNTRYSIGNSTHFALSNYLHKTLGGRVNALTDGTSGLMTTSDAAEAFYRKIDPGWTSTRDGALIYQAGMNHTLQNIATSMTNMIREGRARHFASEDIWNLKSTFMRANGTAWREQAFVRVQWGWIAAPITLAVLSLLFVATTIVQSSRQTSKYMVWKSSSLATLLALNDGAHLQLGGMRNISENESTLKPTRALLVQVGDTEWRLQNPNI